MEDAKGALVGLGGELTEMAVDSFLTDGVLKDLPGVNIAVSAWKTWQGIREYNFLKKLAAFLENFHDCSDEYKEELGSLLNKETGEGKLGEKVIFLLDNAASEVKSKLIGKCLRAYKEEKITCDELQRFWYALDRCFLNDLEFLSCYRSPSKEKQEVGTGLLATGLVNQAGIDSGEIGEEDSGGIIFVLTPLGEKFLQIIYEG